MLRDVHSQLAGEEVDASWREMVDQLEVSGHTWYSILKYITMSKAL